MTLSETASKDNLEGRAALHCLNFGEKFIRERSWPEAVTWLTQAVTIQPNFYEAHCLLGEVYLELGDPAKAIDRLQLAMKLRPNDPTLHLKLGLAYIAVHDWNSALDRYRALRPIDRVVAKQLFDKIVFSFNYELFDSLFNQIY